MESLKHFVQGRTKKNRPIDIIHALYHHPYAHPSSRHEPSHLLLSGFAVPLDDRQPIPESNDKGNTYSELQRYFVDQSIRRVKFEMDGLLCDDYWRATNSEMGKFDWDVILDFSIKSAQDIIMEKAPIIWTLLTSLAINHRRPRLVESRMQSKPCGHGSNRTRDPYLVSARTQSYTLPYRLHPRNKIPIAA